MRALLATALAAAVLGVAWVSAPGSDPVGPTVDLAALEVQREGGLWTLEGAPFSGLAEGRDADDRLRERVVFRAGRRDGLRQRWSAHGLLVAQTPYVAGRRHGLASTSHPNGVLRSLSRFEAGVAQGRQEQWYASGALFKRQQLVDGREVGLQQAWRPNGALYANYEVHEGVPYGLRKGRLCFELEDGELARAE